jgi:hypothetical protein
MFVSQPSRPTRRQMLKRSAAAVLGTSIPWFQALKSHAAMAASGGHRPAKACILLWMNGGPSQAHTFDCKPTDEAKPIPTSVPGIHISEYLPKLADQMPHLALLRTMSHGNFDHQGATFLMQTGYKRNEGGLQHPSLGAIVSHAVGHPNAELPNFVSLGPPQNAKGTGGHLGPRYSPFRLLPGQAIPDLHPIGEHAEANHPARTDLLSQMNKSFLTGRPAPGVAGHDSSLEQAVRIMQTAKTQAFDLDDEPASVRDAYGDSIFGRGCLLARRLVEAGVPFVSVGMRNVGNDWDTHQNTSPRIKELCQELDPAFATLLADLHERGLLDSTLIVWTGEFGRSRNGVEHNNRLWSAALAGGGLKTGQAIGDTGATGKEIVDGRRISPADFFATICAALGIDPHEEYLVRDRPFPRVAHEAQIVRELFY